MFTFNCPVCKKENSSIRIHLKLVEVSGVLIKEVCISNSSKTGISLKDAVLLEDINEYNTYFYSCDNCNGIIVDECGYPIVDKEIIMDLNTENIKYGIIKKEEDIGDEKKIIFFK